MWFVEKYTKPRFPLRTLICRIVMLTHITPSECLWWDIEKYTKPQLPIMTSILPIMTSIYHSLLFLMFLENASYISLMEKREYITSQAKACVCKLPLLAYAKRANISALAPIQLTLTWRDTLRIHGQPYYHRIRASKFWTGLLSWRALLLNTTPQGEDTIKKIQTISRKLSI